MLFYAVALENALTSELIDMALNVKRKKEFQKNVSHMQYEMVI